MPQIATHFLIVPVWGAQYTRICTDFLLPSLLAAGNLDVPRPGVSPVIAFACPPDTRQSIEACPAFAALAGHVRTSFVDNSDLIADPETKYRAMTESIYRTLSSPEVVPGRTVLMFLNPDVVCGAGLITGAVDAMADGARAILIPGLRTRLDDITGTLAGHRDGPALSVPPTDLVRLGTAHLHPLEQIYVWNRGAFPLHWPARVLFDAPDGGLFMQHFHLHPIALVCPDPIPRTIDTVDGDFLEGCGLDPGNTLIPGDASTFAVIEVSGPPYHPDQALAPPSRRRVADFAVRYVSDIHWDFFDHRISYAGPGVPAPREMDRLYRYVRIHRIRLPIARRWPRLDKRLVRPLVHMLASVLAR